MFAGLGRRVQRLDRAAALNFGLRARLIRRLGLGDEVADYMALWTLTRDFIESEEGHALMKAGQANIRRNSAKLLGLRGDRAGLGSLPARTRE